MNVHTVILFILPLFSVISCKRVNFSTPDSLAGVLDMQGVRGSVEFFSHDFTAININWTIRANIAGPIPGERFKWMIYELPVLLHERDSCQEKRLGRQIVDLTDIYGYVQAGEDKVVQSLTALRHVRGLFERTLMLKGIQSPRKVCAIILSSHSVLTYEARFFRNVGGYFAFRQTGIETGIRSHLYWTNGIGKNIKARWSVSRVRENAAANILDPRAWTSNCPLKRSDIVTPLDSHKSKTVSVGEFSDAKAWSYHIDFDLFSLSFGKWWVILLPDDYNITSSQPQQFIACAMITRVEPKQAIAILPNGSDVSGFIRFYQDSPHGDPTLISVNLTIPKRNAGGYGIDEFPIVPGIDNGNNCSRLRLRYYDPLGADVDVIPQPSTGTTDQYQIGDMSGKLGPLLGQRQAIANYYDQYLTLFGTNSIVGRAMVVYGSSWEALACTNVETTEADITIAIAAFHSPLVGLVLFKQSKGRKYADTSVYVELYHEDAEKKTFGHSLTVHERPLILPAGNSTSDCRRTGPPFDPVQTNRTGLYQIQCGPNGPLRCQMGDLSGKYFPIDIPGSAMYADMVMGRYFFTDINFPLHGAVSIAGRPLVVGKENSDDIHDMLACSNIIAVSMTDNEPSARDHSEELLK